MDRARRHQRVFALLAFGLLALVAELAGRSLAHRIDVGRHVRTSYAASEYYPFLLAAVKAGLALLLARLCWRFVRARATARAGRRLLVTFGGRPEEAPRVRLELSPRLWFVSFALTSVFYLVQVDAEGLSQGRWPLLAPWLHTSALPVFAVLAVAVAVLYGAVTRWLAAYESYAAETARRARSLVGLRAASTAAPRPVAVDEHAPRRLFGHAFEVRPPPTPV